MIDCPPELKFLQLYSYPKIILCFLSPFGHTLPPKFFLFIFWNIHFMVNKHSSALNPCPLSCLKETPHSSLLCSFLEWWVFSSPLAGLSRPSNVELKVPPDLWVMLAVYTIHHRTGPDISCNPPHDIGTVSQTFQQLEWNPGDLLILRKTTH